MVRRSARNNPANPIVKRDLPVRTTRNKSSLAVQATPSPTPSARPAPRLKSRTNEDSFEVLRKLVALNSPRYSPTENTERQFGIGEAPTFYPTEEQFQHPDIYIASLRQHAEQFGMCKIVPPDSFQPRFAIDLKGFRFKTEVQKLNHLGAKSRASNNFTEKLRIFQEQNGQHFKTPVFYSKTVDLYRLKLLTRDFGGYAAVGVEKKWAQVGRKIGYNPGECTSLSYGLRNIYETHILPYENYISHANDPMGSTPGVCAICQVANHRPPSLECEQCSRTFHGSCLDPPMKQDFGASFYCYSCLRDYEPAFGFDLGAEYNLSEFLSKAYRFKRAYVDEHAGSYKKHFSLDDGTTSEFEERWVERKFWEQIDSPAREISVEYASDLQASHYGSGFHTAETRPKDPLARHPWNLNNLAANPRNLLASLGDSDSGMTVPWIYIGMMFSAFCWHTEDHFTYSVNYQHWGSPRTCYSVPASHAEQFEEAFKHLAPSLFEKDPDLLYQLVTMLSPADLREARVPVYAATQRPGEFVVTFPRSFYCGFNHGFNFSEAVNFAPADWLPHGQECTLQYKALHRVPVFSHDELLFHSASVATTLSEAVPLHQPLLDMVSREEKARAIVRKHTKQVVENPFPPGRPADIPQCFICSTYCFLSAVTCPCLENKVVCVTHMEEMCNCVLFKRKLQIHVSLDTLTGLVSRVTSLTQPLTIWRKHYLDLVSIHRYPKLEDMELLLSEASALQCLAPDVAALYAHVKVCREWVARTSHVLTNLRVSTHGGPSCDEAHHAIKGLMIECASLSFSPPEMDTLRQLLKDLASFSKSLEENGTPGTAKLLPVTNLAAKLTMDPSEQARFDKVAEDLEWANATLEALNQDPSYSTPQQLLEEAHGRDLSPTHPLLVKLREPPAKAPLVAPANGPVEKPVEKNMPPSQKEIDHWLQVCQHVLFTSHTGKPQTLMTRIESVSATTQALLKSETLERCLCNSYASHKNLLCSDCGVSYHKSCLKPRKSAVISDPYLCPVCDPTFRGPIQRKRPNLVGLQLLLSESPHLKGHIPEYELLSELVDSLCRLRERVLQVGEFKDRVRLKGVVRLFQALDINLPDELKDLIRMLHPRSVYHKRNANTAELTNEPESPPKSKPRRRTFSPLTISSRPISTRPSSPQPQDLAIVAETPPINEPASSQPPDDSGPFSVFNLVGRPISPRTQITSCQRPVLTIRASCPMIHEDDDSD